MRMVELTKGMSSMVDDEDYDMLMQWSWFVHKCRNTFYAGRMHSSKKRHIKMHRVIMGIDDPAIVVDHIDRDGLNNQRSNLRLATSSENLLNAPGWGASGFRGVSFHKKANKWQVAVSHQGKSHWIGLFESINDAALAYNKKASELFGQFAFQNVIKA